MRIITLFILIAFYFNASAQIDSIPKKKKQYPSISTNYHYGNVLPTNDFVKGDNLANEPINHYQSIAIKMLWQNPGYTDWQKVYKGPYYGFGYMVGDFFNPDELGYPMALYGILGVPIKRWEKLELYTEFQFGMAWNWQIYDSITNPKNVAIGGGYSVHLDIGIVAFYPITKKLDIGGGISFTHFSNGGFERPNRGLNLYSPHIELKYHFADRPKSREIGKTPRLKRSNDLYLMLGYGDHQLVEHELDTNYYAIGGLSVIYFTQLSNAFRFGTGADLNYWWGLNAYPDGTIGPRTMNNFTLGLLIQPELIFNKLTLVSGIGIYAIHLDYGNFQQTYQRLGVRYDIYKNISFGVNVRAVNFMLAEFMEFNMGYVMKWEK
ncbi:MAG: hypothetical protein GQ527_00470 [Bacteroidales bacterium]|nr:hypothetical protein [Bacteroidales bacterium]